MGEEIRAPSGEPLTTPTHDGTWGGGASDGISRSFRQGHRPGSIIQPGEEDAGLARREKLQLKNLPTIPHRLYNDCLSRIIVAWLYYRW